MKIQGLIGRKRCGCELTPEEIGFAVRGHLRGEVSDAQMAALLTAIAIRGLSAGETLVLTMEMTRSGRIIEPSGWVDKHSTGGVGDKITLIAAPIAAAAGARVAKLSGRSLGHTGGTLDKLESIPGLSTDLTVDRFRQQVEEVGLAIAGQSAEFVPADRKMYALRDHVGAVDVVPLIAASIMAKKLAGGASGIVLDVKAGQGAFCVTVESARTLAHAMTEIGLRAGRRVVAWVTAMDQPLGQAVGNALEITEVLDVLAGGGPADARQLGVLIAAEMIALSGVVPDLDAAYGAAEDAIASGRALARLRAMIAAQGGEVAVMTDRGQLPRPELSRKVPVPGAGWIARMDARAVGLASQILGAGRKSPGGRIDPAAGVMLERKVGDAVAAGDTLAVVYGRNEEELDLACRWVSEAVTLASSPVAAAPVLIERIG